MRRKSIFFFEDIFLNRFEIDKSFLSCVYFTTFPFVHYPKIWRAVLQTRLLMKKFIAISMAPLVLTPSNRLDSTSRINEGEGFNCSLNGPKIFLRASKSTCNLFLKATRGKTTFAQCVSHPTTTPHPTLRSPGKCNAVSKSFGHLWLISHLQSALQYTPRLKKRGPNAHSSHEILYWIDWMSAPERTTPNAATFQR